MINCSLSSEGALAFSVVVVVYLWYIGLICLMVVLGPVQEEDVTEGIQRSAPCNSMHTCPLLRFTAHQFFLSFFGNSATNSFSWRVMIQALEREKIMVCFNINIFSDILTACCQNQSCWISSRGSSCTCALTFP